MDIQAREAREDPAQHKTQLDSQCTHLFIQPHAVDR